MRKTYDYAIIIRSKTRLEVMTERFNTNQQVQFYLTSNNVSYDQYQEEHDNFYRALDKLCQELSNRIKFKVIDRSFISSFIFSANQLIIVIGQDGLVANTAKYAEGQPIIGVNPDPLRYDGVLLPYNKDTIVQALDNILGTTPCMVGVTMAEAKFSDGQHLLAFNDFYIGSASHSSSRYKIKFNQEEENHSSSGIIVSTGAGSTGWMSSIFNMQEGIAQLLGNDNSNKLSLSKMKTKKSKPQQRTLAWDDEELLFVVREPFLSQASGIELISGCITGKESLSIESMMPTNGVVFSDGIEKDFIRFNSGTTVHIGVSNQKANIVMEKSVAVQKKGQKNNQRNKNNSFSKLKKL